jgi:hypothetical protein
MTTTTAPFAKYTIRSILESNNVSIISSFCMELSKPCGYTLLIHSIPDILNNPTTKMTLEDQMGKTWLLAKPDTCVSDSLSTSEYSAIHLRLKNWL